MAKVRKKRTQYTTQQKKAILAAALKDRLTAIQVKRKFGVTPVTYYSWRRKAGVTRTRTGRAGRVLLARVAAGSGLQGQVRAEVQARVRQILPQIVRGEVNSYLDSLFGSGRRRRARV